MQEQTRERQNNYCILRQELLYSVYMWVLLQPQEQPREQAERLPEYRTWCRTLSSRSAHFRKLHRYDRRYYFREQARLQEQAQERQSNRCNLRR